MNPLDQWVHCVKLDCQTNSIRFAKDLRAYKSNVEVTKTINWDSIQNKNFFLQVVQIFPCLLQWNNIFWVNENLCSVLVKSFQISRIEKRELTVLLYWLSLLFALYSLFLRQKLRVFCLQAGQHWNYRLRDKEWKVRRLFSFVIRACAFFKRDFIARLFYLCF